MTLYDTRLWPSLCGIIIKQLKRDRNGIIYILVLIEDKGRQLSRKHSQNVKLRKYILFWFDFDREKWKADPDIHEVDSSQHDA